MCLLHLFCLMGELFTSSLNFHFFSWTYDSHKLSFLASFEFTANIKGWEDVNKLGKAGGRKPYKDRVTDLQSSMLWFA